MDSLTVTRVVTTRDPATLVIVILIMFRATACVRAQATKANKKTGDAEGAAPQAAFWIGSPLLSGKLQKSRETCCQNLAPFWAVPRTPGTEDNMLLETVFFDVPALVAMAGKSFPCMKKGSKFVFEIQIMRNSKKVLKDDLLLLPFRGE